MSPEMISPTNIMPASLIALGERTRAFQWVLAQPWASDYKLQVWAGWRAVTGGQFDLGEYRLLAASGYEGS
jgi:hypothetical protein